MKKINHLLYRIHFALKLQQDAVRTAASKSVACIILATKVIKTFYQELADLSKVGKILEGRADLFLSH